MVMAEKPNVSIYRIYFWVGLSDVLNVLVILICLVICKDRY